MTEVVGGIRTRLIRDNLLVLVRGILHDLGHLTPVVGRAPVILETAPVDWQTEVAFNTVGVSYGNRPAGVDAEVGSNLARYVRTFFVDVFAENDSVGTHISEDIRDALAGLMPSIGRSTPWFSVYDLRDPTPTALFDVEITSVDSVQAHGFPHPWTTHWFSNTVELEDFYGSNTPVLYPSESTFPSGG